MGHLTVGLLVLAVLASANAFYPLIPEGKELVYNYHGLVRAGSHLPTSYASAFILDGDLHMQTDKNSSFVRFSGLKYKLYNGEYDEWHEFETKEIPLPKELEAFEHPFKVVYEPCGHAWGLAVEKDEPQYVVNVKRGIASMLQMYTEKLDWEKTEPYAFHTKERTVYGKGPYYYTVFPGDNEWTIKKMAEAHSNYHLYSFLSTETKMDTCDAKYDEPLSRDSNQHYVIHKRDGAYVADYIESNAGIYYTPYAGEGYAFHVYMNQSLTLDKIVPATPMTMTNEKFYHGLTYYTADFSNTQGIADIFHGRRTYDMDKMMVKLEDMLYETMKYIKEYHLDLKAPEWSRGQLVNRMLILMYQLDQSHLEAMTAKLLQKTTEEDKEALHVYYHMLPMIGSHDSYMYMMQLMKTKKIKDKLALEWLQSMSFHVKEPNKMLIDHMSEMLNWGEEISTDVRKAAILSFATFIEKAIFRYNKLHHIMNWGGHEDHDVTEDFYADYELDDIFPAPKYYEKYVTLMSEKMKASKDIGMQSVYILALRNMHLEKAIHVLWPIARGKVYEDNYLQYLAINSLGGLVAHNDELVYEIFWPIMADYKLQTNLRIAAYYNIMKTHPSLARMSNLIWQMANEVNMAFYEYHYSYMMAISRTTDPCFEHFRVTVKQMLRYTEVPQYLTMTRFYEIDYMDDKYGYGHQFGGYLIRAPGESETTLKLQMAHTVDHAKFPLYTFLIRVDGMEASIFEDVSLYLKDTSKLFNFEKVWKAYKNIYNNKDIRIDIAVVKYSQVVMTYHYDATNIKDFSYFLDVFVSDKFNYVKKYFSIAYPVQTNVILPTEIGFPALFKFYVPKVYWFDIDFKKEIINNIITFHYDSHMKEMSHSRLVLSFYNPFIDAYQGVTKCNAIEWVQPMYFQMSLNPAQQSMKFTWKRHDDPMKDAYGMKSNTAMFTFVRDDLETHVLQDSSPESRNFIRVVRDEETYIPTVLYDDDNSNTGYHHKVVKFGRDTWATNATIFRMHNYLHYSQNYHTCFGHWFLTKFHALSHLLNPPYPSANGILLSSEVSKQYPATNVDINMRFTTEYKRGDKVLFPGVKNNIRATYAVKNKETTMKMWDANMIIDKEMDHAASTFKAIFSRVMPGEKEWRVCIDGNRKYLGDHLQGEATIAVSHDLEPKCTKDEKIMEIHVKGEKLDEQKKLSHMYGECNEYMWSDIHELNSFACFLARDSYRKWTYDFVTTNIPVEVTKYLKGYFDWMKFSYLRYLTQYETTPETRSKDSWQIVHEYPLVGHKADLHLYTPENGIKFGGIPAKQFPFYYFHMLATEHISPLYRFMKMMGWTQVCEVHPTSYYNTTLQNVHFDMPTEWHMYLGDSETDATIGLWMKYLKNDYSAMKWMSHGHTLEIIPTASKKYDVLMDGKKLPETTYQQDHECFWVDMIKTTGVINIFCKHTGAHITYDGHHAQVEYPNMETPYHGQCA